MKRVFIGIKISKQLQNEVAAWRNKYDSLPVRWIKEKNLHITLIPPFEAPDSRIDELKMVLEKINFQPFDLRFRKITYGPNSRQARLIWAEGRASDEIISLKKDLEKALRILDQHRLFNLHLTLARFRPEKFLTFSITKLEDRILWEEKVQSFQLLESVLSSEGAEYKTLGEFAFNGV